MYKNILITERLSLGQAVLKTFSYASTYFFKEPASELLVLGSI
jgi:hypothetical protein